MILSPLLRAISRCMSARSAASMPSPSMRWAGAPIWLCGSSLMPCASRLRWSIRASISSSASRSLTCSAQRSRHRSTISVRFQSRTFAPKPFSSTLRMVSMTWAWGLGIPSSPMSQCTFRSATCSKLKNAEVRRQKSGRFPIQGFVWFADVPAPIPATPEGRLADLLPWDWQPMATTQKAADRVRHRKLASLTPSNARRFTVA